MIDRLRYVILHHTDCPAPHFDLMLEQDADGPLLTWRLPRWPASLDDIFTPLAPHRRAYLDYEGPISGNRGQVARVEAGRYDCVPSADGHRAVRLLPSGVVLVFPVAEAPLPSSEKVE